MVLARLDHQLNSPNKGGGGVDGVRPSRLSPPPPAAAAAARASPNRSSLSNRRLRQRIARANPSSA